MRQVRLLIPSVTAEGGWVAPKEASGGSSDEVQASLMCLYLQVVAVHHAARVMETMGRQPRNEPDTYRKRAEDFLLKATVTFSLDRVHIRSDPSLKPGFTAKRAAACLPRNVE